MAFSNFVSVEIYPEGTNLLMYEIDKWLSAEEMAELTKGFQALNNTPGKMCGSQTVDIGAEYNEAQPEDILIFLTFSNCSN